MRRLVLLLSLAACRTEWARDYDGPVAAGPRLGRVLVSDAETGRPVSGARVAFHLENALAPDGGWAPLVAETRTDAFGLASLPVATAGGDGHWVVDAPGYAPGHAYGTNVEEDIPLVRGRDLSGRILNGFGEPARDVLVEYKLGCAHSPAQRTARTGADGRFVLRCVSGEGDIRLVGPGVRSDDWDAGALLDPSTSTFHSLPGRTLLGRVVDASGRAVSGVDVVAWTTMRGRAARTAADGSFRIEGTCERDTVDVRSDPPRGFFAGDFRPGGPALLRLGGEEPAGGTIRVRAFDALGRPVEGASLFVEREEDLLRIACDERGEARVPAGRWRAGADGAFDAWIGGPAPVEAGAAGVRVRRQPVLRLDASDVPPDAEYRLSLERESTRFSPESPPRLPANARAAVRALVEGHAVYAAVGPEQDGVRRATLRWSAAPPRRVPDDPVPPRPPASSNAELRIAIEGADDPVVCVDGRTIRESLDAIPLAPGAHLLLAGAGGCAGRAMRVVLAAGERREIRIRLTPRRPDPPAR